MLVSVMIDRKKKPNRIFKSAIGESKREMKIKTKSEMCNNKMEIIKLIVDNGIG